jgi:hypothetical protein
MLNRDTEVHVAEQLGDSEFRLGTGLPCQGVRFGHPELLEQGDGASESGGAALPSYSVCRVAFLKPASVKAEPSHRRATHPAPLRSGVRDGERWAAPTFGREGWFPLAASRLSVSEESPNRIPSRPGLETR